MKLVNLLEAGLQVGDKVWNNKFQEWFEYLGGFRDELHLKNTNNKSIYVDKFGRCNGGKFPSVMLDKPDWELPTKKPEPNWAEVFTLDKPFMVKDKKDQDWHIAYACCYMPSASLPFLVFSDRMSSELARGAGSIDCFRYARELTPEERGQYL